MKTKRFFVWKPKSCFLLGFGWYRSTENALHVQFYLPFLVVDIGQNNNNDLNLYPRSSGG